MDRINIKRAKINPEDNLQHNINHAELQKIKPETVEFKSKDSDAYGGCSYVYFARHDNNPVAVKIFTKVIDPKHEAQLHKTAEHDYVVKLYGYIESPQFNALVMEQCTKGDLLNYINNTKIPSASEDRSRFTMHIGFALSYLHQVCNIIHADIKPDNIMLQETNGVLVAKLSDFGSAILLEPGQSEYHTRDIKGTPDYQAPEYAEFKFSYAVDMFAFGIILKILTATSEEYFIPSFNSAIETFRYNASGAYENTVIDPAFTTEATRKVILKLLRTKPSERMTSKEFAKELESGFTLLKSTL